MTDPVTVLAKMVCRSNEQPDGWDFHLVTLEAVTADSPENATWSKYTPSGRVELSITNPAAFNAFEFGREYMVSFTAV